MSGYGVGRLLSINSTSENHQYGLAYGPLFIVAAAISGVDVHMHCDVEIGELAWSKSQALQESAASCVCPTSHS